MGNASRSPTQSSRSRQPISPAHRELAMIELRLRLLDERTDLGQPTIHRKRQSLLAQKRTLEMIAGVISCLGEGKPAGDRALVD